MFERFTDRARRVVVLAQEEARFLGHDHIGTEHLLLGLVHERDGVAAEALTGLGLDLNAMRLQVERIAGKGGPPPTGHLPFTPRAKKVLELSLRESLSLGHNYIGTEHVLLGLIREGEGVGAQVLVRMGADLPRVRDAVGDLLDRPRPPEVGPEDDGARRIAIDVSGDRIAVLFDDEQFRDRLREVLPPGSSTVTVDQAAAECFPRLWKDLVNHLGEVLLVLMREDATRWRPPGWERAWTVAGYCIMAVKPERGSLDVAPGVDREDAHAGILAWLLANQPTSEEPAGYFAVLVSEDDVGDRRYEVQTGAAANRPALPTNVLAIQAIVDLANPAEGATQE